MDALDDVTSDAEPNLIGCVECAAFPFCNAPPEAGPISNSPHKCWRCGKHYHCELWCAVPMSSVMDGLLLSFTPNQEDFVPGRTEQEFKNMVEDHVAKTICNRCKMVLA